MRGPLAERATALTLCQRQPSPRGVKQGPAQEALPGKCFSAAITTSIQKAPALWGSPFVWSAGHGPILEQVFWPAQTCHHPHLVTMSK